MLTATKKWFCTQCNKDIKPGDHFTIKNGDMLCEEHSKSKPKITIIKKLPIIIKRKS